MLEFVLEHRHDKAMSREQLAIVGLAGHIQLAIVGELADEPDQIGVGLAKPLGRSGPGGLTLRRRVGIVHVSVIERMVGVDVREQSNVPSELPRGAFGPLRDCVPVLVSYRADVVQ